MATPFARTTRALAADSARWAWLAWGLALLGLAAWLAWFALGRVTVVEVSRRARLEAQATPHPLVADRAGRLATLRLTIGRAVQTGEVLATLDASRLQAQRQEEATRLAAVTPRLAAVRAEIGTLTQAISADQRATAAAVQAAQARVREAGAAADFAQDNAQRLSAERGSGAVAEIDALRATADARRQRYAGDALTADARRLTLDADTRAHQLQAQIDALKRQAATLDGDAAGSRAAIARLDAEIDRHQLRAPVAGTLAEVTPLAVGGWLAEGQRLATIVPAGGLVIVADFNPATALGRLQPGQLASLRLDGFPWAQYGAVQARVLRVSGEARDQLLRAELEPLPPGGATGGAVGVTAGHASASTSGMAAITVGNAANTATNNATNSAPAAAQTRTGPPLRHGLSGQVEVSVEDASPAVLLLRAAGQLAAVTPPAPAGTLPAPPTAAAGTAP